MKRLLFLLVGIFTLFLAAAPAFSAVAYVTDVFQIPLRTGASAEYRIIAMPSSGQALEILGSDGDWSHVRLLGESDKEGWILSRYIITRPPWEMQAKALREEKSSLLQKATSLENKLNQTIKENEELSKRAESESKALHALQKDFDSLRKGAENYLNLKTLHEEAERKLAQMKKELDQITTENRRLSSSEKTRWLATGALVLLFGLIIGITIGKREKRRRSHLV